MSYEDIVIVCGCQIRKTDHEYLGSKQGNGEQKLEDDATVMVSMSNRIPSRKMQKEEKTLRLASEPIYSG